MEKIEIYTDGACSQINKNGGYGIVAIYKDSIMLKYEGIKETTSNKMELLAVIEGIKSLKRRCEVIVYSDSEYVVDNIRHNRIYEWRKNNFSKIKNVELWKELIKLLTQHKVNFVKIEAHQDNKYNNMCHTFAYKAAINMLEKTQKYIKINNIRSI